MRRPLCAAALVYALIVLTLLQLMPPETEDFSEYSKSTVILQGTVVSKEYKTSSTDGETCLLITLKDVVVDGWDVQPDGKVMCRTGDGSQEDAESVDALAAIGAAVRISGKLYIYSQATNSGEFDSQLYYRILGYTSFQLQNAEIVAYDTGSDPLGNALYQVKRFLASVLDSCLGEDDASILKAMLLGEKGNLTAEMKSLYQDSGIIHILAISGLHISIIGMGLYRLLRKITLPLPVSAAAAVTVMLLYGKMTGMSASSFRAIVMFLLHMTAMVLRRTYDLLTAVSVAAVLLLASQPLYLYHSGFLFSFGAVLGIALLAPVFSTKVMKTLSITLSTLPVQLACYSTFHIYSIVLNLIVLPLMSTVMVSGLIVLALGSIWIPAGSCAGILTHVILMFYDALCTASSLLPGHTINLGAPAAWQIVIYLGILSAIIFLRKPVETMCEKTAAGWESVRSGPASAGRHLSRILSPVPRRSGAESTDAGRMKIHAEAWEKQSDEMGRGAAMDRIKMTVVREAARLQRAVPIVLQRHPGFLPELLRVLAAAAAVLILCLRFHTGLSLHVIDVGQGDGMLLRCSDAVILIDGGSTSKSSLGEYQLTPLLQYYGVRRLDYIIITHPDSDHTSGTLQVIEESRTHTTGWLGILTDDSTNGITVGALCLPSCAENAQDESYAELIAAAEEKNIPVVYLKEGDIIKGETLKLTCLHPEADSEYEDANAMSTTLYLEYGAFTALLTGDIEGEGEERLLEYVRTQLTEEGIFADAAAARDQSGENAASEDGSDADNTVFHITLLKVAHHGSSGATSETFLQIFRPTLAVISCGVGNSYGHPHEATLERLADAGVNIIYDTRTGGEITFHTDGVTLTVTQFGGELTDN